MPAAEVDVREALVRALLSEQAPSLASRPLALVANGWDNAVFRLGGDLCVRLPRRELAAALVEHEQEWLPRLAPRLPLPIPAPLVAGRPGAGYPWAWSVCPWLAGDVALAAPPEDPFAAAAAMGTFVAALHAQPAAGAPANPYRGVPLADRTARVEEAVRRLGSSIDGPPVLACWADLVTTPPWDGPPVLLHGDLHPANVLVRDGAVSGVIDFGDLAAGDPATDLAVAWMLFPPPARVIFRDAVGGVDDHTWARARAWALSLALAFLGSSADNPPFAALGSQTLGAVLAG